MKPRRQKKPRPRGAILARGNTLRARRTRAPILEAGPINEVLCKIISPGNRVTVG
jgi:hypothetical protein